MRFGANYLLLIFPTKLKVNVPKFYLIPLSIFKMFRFFISFKHEIIKKDVINLRLMIAGK